MAGREEPYQAQRGPRRSITHKGAWSIKQKGALQNSPIICAIHLMYWHACLDRAPDHVFRSAAARKRHDQIGLAFVKHPLIAQWASFLAEFVPLALRDLIWLARDAPAPRPSISHPVSAARQLPSPRPCGADPPSCGGLKPLGALFRLLDFSPSFFLFFSPPRISQSC